MLGGVTGGVNDGDASRPKPSVAVYRLIPGRESPEDSNAERGELRLNLRSERSGSCQAPWLEQDPRHGPRVRDLHAKSVVDLRKRAQFAKMR